MSVLRQWPDFVNFTSLARTAASYRSVLLELKEDRMQGLGARKEERKARGFGFAALLAKDPHELIGSGLQEVVAHEIGHCLGLRHNFKGSLGVSALATRGFRGR